MITSYMKNSEGKKETHTEFTETCYIYLKVLQEWVTKTVNIVLL